MLSYAFLHPDNQSGGGGALVNQAPSALSGVVSTFFYKALTARGGTPPYAWSITAGTLPGDLLIETTGDTAAGQFGQIRASLPFGTSSRGPMESGSFPVTIRVTDSLGATSDKNCTITIQAYSFVPTNAKVGPGWGAAFSFMLDEESEIDSTGAGFSILDFMTEGMWASGVFGIGSNGGAYLSTNVWCCATIVPVTANTLCLNGAAMGANNHLSQFRVTFVGNKLNIFGPALFCAEAWNSLIHSGLPINVLAWRYAALINADTGRADLFFNDGTGKNSIANVTGLTIASGDVFALRAVKTGAATMTLTVEQNSVAVITAAGRTLITMGNPGVLVRTIDNTGRVELDLFASKVY